jgi:biopolymer transport protein TolR
MGTAIQNGGGPPRRRGRRRARMRPMAEINVTPMVDVMLVLLIIFMVAAPLMTVGVPVDLPKTQANAGAETSQKEPLIISVNQNGRIFLQESEITLDEIGAKLTAIAKGGNQQVIYIRGDGRASYGAFMQVMGKVSAAGFQRISLVTEVEDRH